MSAILGREISNVDTNVDAARLEARATSTQVLMWGAGLRLTCAAGKKGACFIMTPSIALPSLYREAVTSLASGKSPETVLDSLVQKGLLERYARTLMAAALAESRSIHN